MLNQSRHPLLVLGAGGGKTKISIKVIKNRIELKKRVLVLVPQIEILDQWVLDCAEENISYGYINDEGIIGRNKDVYICMFQSLSNILVSLPEKFVMSFNEIITDESHRSSAQSYRDIYSHFEHCLRMGLTASPYRMDNQPLGEFYTDLFVPISNTEAKEQGFLCEPIIIVPDEYRDYVPVVGQEVNANEQKQFIKDKKIIGDMVQVYKDVFNGLPIIAPCSSHKHGQVVKELYEKAGWKVDHIHSGLSKGDRKAILRRVRTGKTNILISVGVGVEGMDVPGLYGIIWLRFTDSLTIWIQFNGRAARVLKDKKYYVLVDPVGNSVIHGRPDIDRKWSLDTDYVPGQDIPDSPVSRICPVCSVVNSSENNSCWICGYDFLTGLLDGEIVEKKKRRLPSFVDGELVYLDDKFMDGEDDNNRYNNTNTNKSDILDNDVCNAELSKVEKVEILSKNLTGLKIKSKFREGLKWL